MLWQVPCNFWRCHSSFDIIHVPWNTERSSAQDVEVVTCWGEGKLEQINQRIWAIQAIKTWKSCLIWPPAQCKAILISISGLHLSFENLLQLLCTFPSSAPARRRWFFFSFGPVRISLQAIWLSLLFLCTPGRSVAPFSLPAGPPGHLLWGRTSEFPHRAALQPWLAQGLSADAFPAFWCPKHSQNTQQGNEHLLWAAQDGAALCCQLSRSCWALRPGRAIWINTRFVGASRGKELF